VPQLSEPNIIHLQLTVSFFIPFNLLDSARSQSEICIVYLGGMGGKDGTRALGCLIYGSCDRTLAQGRIVSVPGATGCDHRIACDLGKGG
jgi:hypothetical protein